ncbi:MAG: alpha/beta hydrolase-fold protein [Gemmatimonadaceae bacterium]|jgi:predicted alpha/beta superfamily hydrolase|nr:alpha/beta hydrolase-fold protein [Gemmatimonadaceae bacterium]
MSHENSTTLADSPRAWPQWPQAHGALELWADVPSRFLANGHDVVVCLPPGYADEPARRYPVLYLHDGQNVFHDFPRSPFGVQWGIDTTMRQLVADGMIEPVILVGIGNAGRDRIDEYTPTRDARHDAGGKADRYARMLIEEIKPFIDRRYRSLPDPFNTGVCGSSLGGLLSLYLGVSHPGVFGKLAVLSPSVWWDDRWIVRRLLDRPVHPAHMRIWLDVGTHEPRMVKSVQLLNRTLLRAGWRPGYDLVYHEAEGHGHNEASWGERASMFLVYLFSAVQTHGFS